MVQRPKSLLESAKKVPFEAVLDALVLCFPHLYHLNTHTPLVTLAITANANPHRHLVNASSHFEGSRHSLHEPVFVALLGFERFAPYDCMPSNPTKALGKCCTSYSRLLQTLGSVHHPVARTCPGGRVSTMAPHTQVVNLTAKCCCHTPQTRRCLCIP